MLLGLISDTHIPQVTPHLPPEIKDIFKDVDLILHAGDIYTVSVLDELERIAPVLAAEGDDDYPEVMRDRRVKMSHTLTIESLTLHLTHDRSWDWPFVKKDQYSASRQPEKLPDIIVFGHTHMATVENNEGVLLVNPGSPTFPNYLHKSGTVALLSVNSGKAEAHTVHLQRKL